MYSILACTPALVPGHRRNGLATSMSSNYKRNVMAIAIAHSSCEYWSSACDFSSRWEWGLIFLQVFAAGSTTELRQLFKQNAIVQNTYTSMIERSTMQSKEKGVTVLLNYMMQLLLLLSCDDVLKVGWNCKLSSSRSNNLKLQKLTGHLFYNLGMRLKCTTDDLSHRVTTKILGMAAILTKRPVLLWVCLQ